VRTPTDIIGQHIHLPKWDLTTADGAANGWNYEDGTLSPGMVQERIHAINDGQGGIPDPEEPTGFRELVAAYPSDPDFPADVPGSGIPLYPEWDGARVTTQRWFVDPVYNVAGDDRGLGIIFTHDHYGPSSFQQIGLYSGSTTRPVRSLRRAPTAARSHGRRSSSRDHPMVLPRSPTSSRSASSTSSSATSSTPMKPACTWAPDPTDGRRRPTVPTATTSATR
jgi:hypothetical protein